MIVAPHYDTEDSVEQENEREACTRGQKNFLLLYAFSAQGTPLCFSMFSREKFREGEEDRREWESERRQKMRD